MTEEERAAERKAVEERFMDASMKAFKMRGELEELVAASPDVFSWVYPNPDWSGKKRADSEEVKLSRANYKRMAAEAKTLGITVDEHVSNILQKVLEEKGWK